MSDQQHVNPFVMLIPGKTYAVDHQVTEFRVKVRHIGWLNEEIITRLIQKEYEVVDCEFVNETTYMRGG